MIHCVMCASVTGAYLQPLNCHLFLTNSSPLLLNSSLLLLNSSLFLSLRFLDSSVLLSHSYLHMYSIEYTPDIMSAQYGHGPKLGVGAYTENTLCILSVPYCPE